MTKFTATALHAQTMLGGLAMSVGAALNLPAVAIAGAGLAIVVELRLLVHAVVENTEAKH